MPPLSPCAARPTSHKLMQGDARNLSFIPDESVHLIVTSPPFALIRQKAYGNVAHGDYIEWFWPFAEEIHRVLRPDGSFSWVSTTTSIPPAVTAAGAFWARWVQAPPRWQSAEQSGFLRPGLGVFAGLRLALDPIVPGSKP